jgi:glycosyltransferase involved in cell wall biosynthesis
VDYFYSVNVARGARPLNEHTRDPASAPIARLCFVATAPYAINVYLKTQLLQLVAKGYSVTVCTNLKQIGGDVTLPSVFRVVDIPISRQIDLLRDLLSFIRLLVFFRRERFDVVHSLLPKSGLLSMIAARLSGTQHRVHTFTGQVWTTSTGARRTLLKFADRIIALCASRLLADSVSQCAILVKEKVVQPEKISVLANGSIAGVDVSRFTFDQRARKKIRRLHGIPADSLVILFVGRMTREKGIFELLQAFVKLRREQGFRRDIRLLLVGPNDSEKVGALPSIEGVEYVGYSPAIQCYFSAADIFCLPSYREGFGSVLIEAGAVGLPVVATRIYGIADAVVDRKTGLLVEPRNVEQLFQAINKLIGDKKLAKSMGEQGRARAIELFSSEIVCTAWLGFYIRLLEHESRSSLRP